MTDKLTIPIGKVTMIAGAIAAIGAGVAAWQQLGGPLPASQAYVMSVQAEAAENLEDVTRDLETLRQFGVDTRVLVLGQELAGVRKDQIELELKMKTEPTPAMIRLASELQDHAMKLERQITQLERQAAREVLEWQ